MTGGFSGCGGVGVTGGGLEIMAELLRRLIAAVLFLAFTSTV
jgi:hypothetical protein